MIRLGRRRLAIGLLLFVVLPIVEIWLLVLLGQQIGALPVLAGVVVEGIIGSWLIRRRWRTAWQSLQEASAGGIGVPRSEDALPNALDTAVFVAGGIALIFPGMITDVIALICLIPFTRRLPKALLGRLVDRQLAGLDDLATRNGMPGGFGRRRGEPGYGDVIEGEVVDEPSDGNSSRRNPDEPVVIRGEIDDS
ncbi:FxsA family protein [Microlunatus elymi]|uniref:FxsA family protein n=1 Tax=Microlunatus elymi TaxID=2596828 RepID=A0A516Q0A6_9ACTN|nr:FxsA family protein [Microlunatus elymi]QDP96863.1 FxsA family protein [Microlunatus elymi]